MLAAVVFVVALGGAVLSAPQDVKFDFEKSVAVRTDGGGDGGHVGGGGGSGGGTGGGSSGGSVQVVRVHKDPAHMRQAAQDFFSSASGQALDQAGAQFFRALGGLAQRSQGQVSGGGGGFVSGGQSSGGFVSGGQGSGGFVSSGQSSGGQTRANVGGTQTQTSHRFEGSNKSPTHRQAAQDFYSSDSGQALDQAGARFFTSLGNFLSQLLGGGRSNHH